MTKGTKQLLIWGAVIAGGIFVISQIRKKKSTAAVASTAGNGIKPGTVISMPLKEQQVSTAGTIPRDKREEIRTGDTIVSRVF